jgi:phospholipid/cholesterol/gamma-HCH transport system substrate-binding protein
MKPMHQRNQVVVGIVGILITALIVYIAFNGNNLPLIGTSGTGYTAYFPEAAGLQPGNEVRVAGVTVGRVTGVSLDGAQVRVTFSATGWVGNASTVSIQIRTLLGAKYLALDPLGTGPQNPSVPIPQSRTSSPYDVTQALNQLGTTFQQIDTENVTKSLQAIASAFQNTPPAVHEALTGLSALSNVVSSQNVQIAELLQGTKKITGTLASENSEFAQLFSNGNLLLAELEQQQQAIGSLLTGTEAMAVQLTGLVKDDNAQLGPMLSKLSNVTSVLTANQKNLNSALALIGPYANVLTDLTGNGRWFDAYLCGLIPRSYGGTQPSSGCIPPKVGG